MASSSRSPYSVFVSYAEEDRATISFPLREDLLKHGITAFVDEEDIPGGSWSEKATNKAMKNAEIAVIVLSPEYIARKRSMKELLCFLRRTENPLGDERPLSVIIPLYYRLSEKELGDEPRLDRLDRDGKSLYGVSRFLERMERGEPEANYARIKASLHKLRDAVGVSNYVAASNDSTSIMLKRRSVLLKDTCEQVQEALKRLHQITTDTTEQPEEVPHGTGFRSQYYQDDDVSDLVLDFREANQDGTATTIEADVLKAILDRSGGKSVISIQGIGGVGKTSILRGLSNLDAVNQRFQSGTYLISLGSDATRSGLMESLCKLVQRSGGEKNANEMRKEKDWKDVFKEFRSWFAEKECLFMVDDVWETSEITSAVVHVLSKLYLSGANSKVLITTRGKEIASRAEKCFVLQPREPQDSQCRAILKHHSGTEVNASSAEDERAVTDILRICSGLPLFLKLAGRAVKALSLEAGSKGSAAYRLYSRTLGVSMQGLLNIDVDSYDRLASSLSVSVDLVERRKDRWGFPVHLRSAEMHRRLGALVRQSRVPMKMLRYLWELRSEAEATIVAREFDQVALATVYVKEVNSEYVELLGVHDSLHEYALGETKKRGEEILGHKIVLEGYGKGLEREQGCRAWWSRQLDADGYVHMHVCRHLMMGGLEDELVNLLLRPEWTIRSFEQCGILNLERDYSLGISHLKKRDDELRQVQTLQQDSQRATEIATALQMVSEATRLSSGFNICNPRELCFQLYGRLKVYAEESAVIKEYLCRLREKAKKLWGPWLRCISSFLTSPGGTVTRILQLGSTLTCMTLSNDGNFAFCGCSNGRIVALDIRSGEVVMQRPAHEEWINSLVFSNDGTFLFSGSRDGTVKAWENGTGPLVGVFKFILSPLIVCLASVPGVGKGKQIVSALSDGTVHVRAFESGRVLVEPFRVHDGQITCMAVFPDGEHIVSGGDDRRLRIWSATSGEQTVDAFVGHLERVTCVSVMPDGRHVVSGSDDCTVRIWDIKKRIQVGKSFKCLQRRVTCVAVSTDGGRVASGGVDDAIHVWDAQSAAEVCKSLKGHTDIVYGVLFHPVDDKLISYSYDGTVREWDLSKPNDERIWDRHKAPVVSITFASDGKHVISVSWDRSVRIWQAISGRQLGKLLLSQSNFVVDANWVVTADAGRVISVSSDSTVQVWDLESQELVHKFTFDKKIIESLALAPNGDQLVTSSKDGIFRVWDLTHGADHCNLNRTNGVRELLWEMSLGVLSKISVVLSHGIPSPVGSKVFISDDGLRVIGLFGNEANLWDLETRQHLRTVDAGPIGTAWLSHSMIMELLGESIQEAGTDSFSLTDQAVWYYSDEGKVLLGNLEGNVECWALSPDKRTICAGLEDGRVIFMKVET